MYHLLVYPNRRQCCGIDKHSRLAFAFTERQHVTTKHISKHLFKTEKAALAKEKKSRVSFSSLSLNLCYFTKGLWDLSNQISMSLDLHQNTGAFGILKLV